MNHYLDTHLNGHALVADSPTDVIRFAVQHNHGQHFFPSAEWIGHTIPGGWSGLEAALHDPWKNGADEVSRCLYELRKAGELPPARNIRRRGRWSEEGEEACIDRLMDGEEAFYREMKRQAVCSTRNVCILCHTGGGANVKAVDLFWRGAAVIAITDLLQEAGYSVELWVWALAFECYYKPHHWSFVCAKFKEAGEELDTDTAAKVLSGWFFRAGIMGAERHLLCKKGQGKSYSVLGPWQKYLDLDNSVQTVQMPVVYDRASAIAGAREVIKKVNET